MPAWTFCVPHLPARDVPAAQAWYRDVLGLEINWLWLTDFGSVGQDCVELFLYESESPQPTYVSIFVADVDAVYAACQERGGEIVTALEEKPWNVREFTIRDPDGNLLRVGSSVGGEPAGEFTIPQGAEA